MSRPRAKVPCPECGGPKKKVAERCSPCARKLRRKVYSCGKCGGPVSRPEVKMCLACHQQNSTEQNHCPICGGPKSWNSKLCGTCDQAARRTSREDWHGIVQSFNPLAFRNEIGRADLEWSTRQLAEVSGVSRSTIDKWLRGASKPSRPELNAVLAVLAFETCGACSGLGHVDPTQTKRQAVERRVTRPTKIPRPVARVALAPAIPVSVGRLVVDPGAREIRLDGAVIELTKSEAAISAVLAANAGRLMTSDELARLAGISGSGAVRTHLGRLRPKLARIGALSYIVSGKGSGIAMSAQCERGERRSA